MLSQLTSLHKMKQKISITVNKEIVEEIDAKVAVGIFRNKSHVVEYAVKKLLEEKDGNR